MRSTVVCLAALLTACPSPEQPAPQASPTPTPASASASAKPTPVEPATPPAPSEPATPPQAPVVPPPPPAGALATVTEAAPFPLPQMLGKAPTEIQPRLGEPTGKGMSRTSCLRYLPERTWFDCKYAWQRYEDPSGTYAAVAVGYEDGKSVSMSFEAIPGEGEFEPKAALAQLGVTLPGEPAITEPKEGVKVWSWFNSNARLLIHDQQYRVEVSAVDGKWEHSKVELLLNHPLSEAQLAKVKQPGNASASE